MTRQDYDGKTCTSPAHLASIAAVPTHAVFSLRAARMGLRPLLLRGFIMSDLEKANTPRLKLKRMKGPLRRHLAHGWLRAICSEPQRDGSPGGDESSSPPRQELVLPGPGPGSTTSECFDSLMAAIQDAASSGLYKLSFVIDETHRVDADARHGMLKKRQLDDARIAKIMGGKDRPLRPDRSNDLLRTIGIMNADGTISAKNAKKYKQVNHLVALCRPSWERALRNRPESEGPLRVLDLGCGNSTLGFVLCEALRLAKIDYRLHGIDVREELIESCIGRAKQLSDDFSSFSVERIQNGNEAAHRHLGGTPDLVVALHACDTATDEALALAIRAGVQSIFCVPCCQAELAAQWTESARDESSADGMTFPALVQHGLFRRAYADLLTDALRVEVLEACGYTVQVVEFVAHEHTAKNILLRAHLARGPQAPDLARIEAIRSRCQALAINPALLRILAAHLA